MKINIHLEKELAKKYGRRAFPARTGDKVKVLRGSFKGVIGKIEKINKKTSRMIIEGVDKEKSDGSKFRPSINASNCLLISLDLSDQKRKQKLSEKNAS
ncbi:MAG: 50S ribosomal protein L24 [Candidatus Altiarchaeota archaeon]|nr:50S ribosomal protein L24 [Candidatus Altiarchaeota archaeon]